VLKFPVVYAHRGANKFAPENSLAAFQKAIDMGADGIELDVRFTADEDVIVFHDRNANRMTGVRASIQRLALPEIKRLRLFHSQFGSERIPVLQEVLDLAGDDVLINIDVKKESFSKNGFEEKIVSILKDFGLEDNIVISSFNPFVLKRFSILNPGIHLGFIFRNRSSMMMLNGHPVRSLHARHSLLSKKYLQALENRGNRIYAWTVDDEQIMFELIRKEVDGIITNKPEVYLDLKSRIIDKCSREIEELFSNFKQEYLDSKD
jgi:glycerophosphoryl diester phosphodiesterase